MKRFKIVYALLFLVTCLSLTGCGSNSDDTTGTDTGIIDEGDTNGGTEESSETTTEDNNEENSDDNSEADENGGITGEEGVDGSDDSGAAEEGADGAAGLNNTADSADDNLGGTADDTTLNDGDTLDGNTIDGGTITGRAESLFEGNDNIGLAGSENIIGNKTLLY
ncbi:MAG: hypothetical protein LUG66_01770 [Clostridiales bacterium]|nr:hypothetical protein [Clostridiales bacterium]